MPAVILHLVAVERLAPEEGSLPSAMARALREDMEYARFGAALWELPWFGSATAELARLALGAGPRTPPAALTLRSAPAELALALAERVTRGAMVGREAGLAVLCGAFTHLAVSARLRPIQERLLGAPPPWGEEELRAVRGIEWVQSLLWIRSVYGYDLVGTPSLMEHFRVRKRRGYPFSGVGRGLSLLVRSAALEATGWAPTAAELDRWVRGLWLFGRALASPLARGLALPEEVPAASQALFASEGVDLRAAVEAGLQDARNSLFVLHELMRANDFSPEAKRRFLLETPLGREPGEPLPVTT